MCENLLKSILNGSLNTDSVIKWLKNEVLEEDSYRKISSYECSQGEFILFFLNYLHEETSGILQSFSSQMTPNRIKTPRRIESFSSQKTNQSDSKKTVARRTALFPDAQRNQNDLLGISNLESDSKLSPSRMTSTPRQNKTRTSFDKSLTLDSDNSINPMSPISPVYYRNRSGVEVKNKSITPKTSRLDSSNFCLGDFIVQRKVSSKKKQNKQLNSVSRETDESFDQTNDKPNIENCLNQSNVEKSTDEPENKSFLKFNRRRINPTSLSQDGGILNSKRITPHDTKNSFSFQKLSETEISGENSREHRDILREERLKFLSRSQTKETNNIPEILAPRNVRNQNVCIIHPNIESVTFKTQLDSLSQIYSLLLDLNLVLNILSELYFLITLILIQFDNFKSNEHNLEAIEELRKTLKNNLTDLNDDSFQNIEGLFKTVHNCVYFAASVLSKQNHLLSALDRPSLKLLQENSRLKIFAPSLTKQLAMYHGRKTEIKTEIYFTSGGENVSFISDTDNRENFPNDSAFHAFRKQRDLFYDLLQIWETNHLQPGWSFPFALNNKIRSLISMHPDPVNAMHLARLFKNQLLAECSQISDSGPLPSCLNGLANVNAEKLCRLRSRLVCKKSTGGPSPEPAFPGRQEFYKEFISTCDSPGFHRHLIDCLAAEILQLDDTVFSSSDVDETDGAVDPGIQSLYINSLKSLKVLAKFLGLLDSFPYKTEYPPNHQILTTQIAIRKHFIPSINIIHRLNEALKVGKLTITIPWITDYLAMLDHLTLRLPYFSQLIETLFEIHYNSELYLKFPAKLERILMIKLSLGWLFERSNFPLESYQSWITKKYLQQSNSEIVISNGICNNSNDLYIDQLDLVDETVLFTCCPYLIEIRNFLNSDPSSNFNKSGPTKYIRPISTIGDNSDVSKKRLQKQLEEAFFHNQPASTRKTIDLVIERVASACVKFICNSLVPDAKEASLDKFRNHLEHILSLSNTEIREQISICCIKRAKELSDKCFEEFKNSSKDQISQCTKLRCENSLKALLADDVHPIARVTCVSIAVQQSSDRIKQWFNSHVNPGIFLKEFVSEMENVKHETSKNAKKLSYKLPSKGKNVQHNPDAKSPVTLMADIREIMFKVHEQSDEVKLEHLKEMLDDTKLTCQQRCDLNPIAQFTICRMFFDMFFMLATRRADLAENPDFIDELLSYWDKHLDKHQRTTFFDRVFCPRNAGMFELSSQPDKTWQACGKLLIQLLRRNMLKSDKFEKQTIAMFRYEWPSSMVKHFTKCVQSAVDDYVSRNGTQENFTFILSWVANYCNDEEFF